MLDLSLDRLFFEKFQVTLQAESNTYLPFFAAPSLRGALGWGLKDVSCTLKHQKCQNCILKNNCAYSVLFETPLPENASVLKFQKNIPHPVVIETELRKKNTVKKGEALLFNIIVAGKALKYIPYLISAIDRMAKNGMGRDKKPFTLMSVKRFTFNIEQPFETVWNKDNTDSIKTSKSHTVADVITSSTPHNRVTVQFLTPVKITSQGTTEFPVTFRSFARSLFSRLSAMLEFYSGITLNADVSEFIKMAATVKTVNDMQKKDRLNRWSSRQKRSVHLYGASGEVTWQGDAVKELWQLLQFGEIFHAGKSTIMGMGRYRLISSANPL